MAQRQVPDFSPGLSRQHSIIALLPLSSIQLYFITGQQLASHNVCPGAPSRRAHDHHFHEVIKDHDPSRSGLTAVGTTWNVPPDCALPCRSLLTVHMACMAPFEGYAGRSPLTWFSCWGSRRYESCLDSSIRAHASGAHSSCVQVCCMLVLMEELYILVLDVCLQERV